MKPERPAESASISAQFDEIAFLYDELMTGVPYSEWVKHVERILYKMGRKAPTPPQPSPQRGGSRESDSLPVAGRVGEGSGARRTGGMRVLDLCCGTGSASIVMAERGFDVTGIDISAEMIEIARTKAREAGREIGYFVGDASSFSIPGKFDLVVSLFDSLNYILEASKLQQAFDRVSVHLEQDGLFIFDMNTEFALAAGFFDQSNIVSRGPVLYDWTSSYNSLTRICRINMKFVYRRGPKPREIELVHFQRAYDIEEVCAMLRTSGLEVDAVYGGYSFRPASRRSDRIFIVARKATGSKSSRLLIMRPNGCHSERSEESRRAERDSSLRSE